MNKIKELMLDVLLPKHCLGCGREGQYICESCELFLNELPSGADNLFTVWEYEGIIEKAIKKIKCEKMFHLVGELVEKAFERVELNLPPDTQISYVPTSRKKEKERGFNQAELIAKKVGEVLDKKVIKTLLKVKESRSQSGLSLKERRENVKDSFEAIDSFLPENILLVDDYFCSGATLAECQKVLKEKGVKNIWGFTLAKSNH